MGNVFFPEKAGGGLGMSFVRVDRNWVRGVGKVGLADGVRLQNYVSVGLGVWVRLGYS